MAKNRGLLGVIGIAFPILIALGLCFIVRGVQLCGNVAEGKDARTALVAGDTIPSANLPRHPDGRPAYTFECVTERRPSKFSWPFVLLGIGVVGGILFLLGKDWITKSREKPENFTAPKYWTCPQCRFVNVEPEQKCGNCGFQRLGKPK